MAARATVETSLALKRSATVKAASSVTEGYAIKFHTDGTVLNCTAGDAADGYALESGAAGEVVSYIAVGSTASVKAKVGTGGATIGAWLKMANDGVTDAGTLGGGTTLINIVGKAVQTGNAADFIGVIPIAFAGVKA